MSFAKYCQEVRLTRSTGQATEHSYRPGFKDLLEGVGGDGIRAVNEPTHADYGAPDFIVQRRGVPVGHIECKDVGADLDAVEQSEQLERYREALPNLLLTDYLEFRWFFNGERRAAASLGRFDSAGEKIMRTDSDDAVRRLLTDFFDAEAPVVGDPADLARRMASKTRLLRTAIDQILTNDADNALTLKGLLASYREVLINGLSVSDFADLQAQTAAYGLFAARCLHSGPASQFSRQSAAFAVTTPFLQEVFELVAGPRAESRITWIIDDLALLLERADMASVLEGFGAASRKEDPIVHFYEDFLAAYDPDQREMRGVYYTPEPVVSYIVRSIDWVLRNRLELTDGLADTATVDVVSDDGSTRTLPRVLVLDPAVGTGTFLREVVAHIRDDLTRRELAGAWSSYVPEHLLPRLFGFELLMAAYTICHLKLALEISGDSEQYTLPEGKRLGVFLTNTLTEAHEEAGGPMFAPEIAREAREADAVKRDRPVMVVLGNPPYSGHSANKGAWINDLLRGRVADDPQSYFKVNGELLGERNSKWLNDDYVKFIRFAQWRINRTGEGVLGFVTNHSYLDNPTFRGMRRSLLETFDEIWILDLHGNSKRKERSPDGSVDQNVFDIQQGVAISIFVKTGGEGDGYAQVRHADLWGERGDATAGKYAWLAEHDIDSTRWQEVEPQAPDYLFVPRDYTLLTEYEAGWKLTDIAPVNSVGIVTARDKIAIEWSDADMRRVAADFVRLSEADAREQHHIGPDSRQWQLAAAQDDIQTHDDASQHIKPVLYRPFDTRSTYFTGTSGGFICRPRVKIMRHMLPGTNLGLIACRQQSQHGAWCHVGVTRNITESGAISNKTKEINYLFPLYLYLEVDNMLDVGVAGRSPNLAPGYVDAIAERIAMQFSSDGHGDLESTFGPEDIFHYIYAVLHSPHYRRKYADFLRSDFPRIPVPADRAKFAQLARFGARLTALHLMTEHGDELPAFATDGSSKVERVRYSEPSRDTPGRVWINRDQHFEGVSPQTWQFTIGGYQPAKKWLQDRKGRVLNFEDIQNYQRICAALAETPRVMQQIDSVIEAQIEPSTQ